MKTKAEYAEFEKSVAEFLSRNHVKPGCHSNTEPEAEPFFSWRPCECCGSRLGGDREEYSFACENSDPTFTAKICVDCVYYLAYGVLDDMTMMEIEAAQ